MLANTSNLPHALDYAQRGWRVVRTDTGRKYPTMKNWQDNATTDLARIEHWYTQYPSSNICIATGEESNLFVLDVDGEAGESTLFDLQRTYSQLPLTYTVSTRSGGLHYYFTWEGIDFPLGNSAGKLGTGLDTRGSGGQVVAPPSYAVADHKGPEGFYSVLRDVPAVPAPEWLLALLRPAQSFYEAGTLAEELPDTVSCYGGKALKSALSNILNAPQGTRQTTMYQETLSMKAIFTAGGLGNDEEYVKTSLFQTAVDSGLSEDRAERVYTAWRDTPVSPRKLPESVGLSPDDFTEDPELPTYSLDDFGNGDRIIAEHGDSLAYISDKRDWSTYTGSKWELGSATALIRAKVKDVLRNMQETEEQGWTPGDDRKAFLTHCKKSRSTASVNAAFSTLADEASLHRKSEQFDKDLHLINFLNGTMDTRNLSFRAHDKNDYITREMPINYNSEAKAPVWEKFLSDAVPDDSVRRFLQILVGYTLTGHGTDKVIPWLHGPKNTGKSRVTVTLTKLFGSDYGVTASASLLYAQQHQSSGPNEALDALRSRRFVAMSETGKHEFDEELLKKLSGGGENISSRGLQAKQSEWKAECVIWVGSNTTPYIRSNDNATWGRFLPIEFNNVVTPTSPGYDPLLQDKLDGELEGIMTWAVEGLRMYNQEGKLVIPEIVTGYIKSFRDAADLVSQFLTDMFEDNLYHENAEKTTENMIPKTQVIADFNNWVAKYGHGKPWKTATLVERLESLGHSEGRTAKVRGFKGIMSPYTTPF